MNDENKKEAKTEKEEMEKPKIEKEMNENKNQVKEEGA